MRSWTLGKWRKVVSSQKAMNHEWLWTFQLTSISSNSHRVFTNAFTLRAALPAALCQPVPEPWKPRNLSERIPTWNIFRTWEPVATHRNLEPVPEPPQLAQNTPKSILCKDPIAFANKDGRRSSHLTFCREWADFYHANQDLHQDTSCSLMSWESSRNTQLKLLPRMTGQCHRVRLWATINLGIIEPRKEGPESSPSCQSWSMRPGIIQFLNHQSWAPTNHGN